MAIILMIYSRVNKSLDDVKYDMAILLLAIRKHQFFNILFENTLIAGMQSDAPCVNVAMHFKEEELVARIWENRKTVEISVALTEKPGANPYFSKVIHKVIEEALNSWELANDYFLFTADLVKTLTQSLPNPVTLTLNQHLIEYPDETNDDDSGYYVDFYSDQHLDARTLQKDAVALAKECSNNIKSLLPGLDEEAHQGIIENSLNVITTNQSHFIFAIRGLDVDPERLEKITEDIIDMVNRLFPEKNYTLKFYGLTKDIFANSTLQKKVASYHTELLQALNIPAQEIPAEFICPIRSEEVGTPQVMDMPVRLNGYVLDYHSLKYVAAYNSQSPFDRSFVDLNNLTIDTGLLSRIQDFIKSKIDIVFEFNKPVLPANSTTSFPGSPITANGDAIAKLARYIRYAVSGNNVFKSILTAFEKGEYSQALRRVCVDKSEITLCILKAMLEIRYILKLNINEQAGPANRNALHYAAMANFKEAYYLLIRHGGNKQLVDNNNFSAEKYFEFANPRPNPNECKIS